MNPNKALLDQLMGTNRNGDARFLHFTDREVCKAFLCGLCPKVLFTNTKHDLGGCALVHSDELKAEYEKARASRDYGYERQLELELTDIMDSVRKKIRMAQKRLETTAPIASTAEDVEKLNKEIEALSAQAEALGEEGKVDESKALFMRCEELKAEKLRVMSGLPQPAAAVGDGEAQQQALRVCEVCGAYLSLLESDRGLADHFGGKMHQGYKRIQEKLDELANARVQRERVRERESSPPRRSDRGSPRSSRDRYSRDDDRDRERDRDRDSRSRRDSRDDDRDRYRRDSRDSRDRDRDRDYRDRDYDRRRY
eukprot:m51a1_g9417 putative rna-binding protein luc7-like 1 isoform x1 (311) ;mRNA; r:363736-364787